MFDISIQFMLQFINLLPALIPFILIMNLISSILWGDK